MSNRMVVKAKGLWDASGAPMVEDAALLVADGRVVAAGAYEEVSCQLTGDEIVVDYSDKYVIPGMIDAHTHVVVDPEADFTGYIGRDSDTRIAHRGMVNLKKTLDGGVTFIRDLGGYHHVDVELKKLLNEGKIEGCGMLAGGEMITMTGGHGWKMGRECDGEEEVRKAARIQIKAGADLIKIMATGGNLTPGPQGAPQLSEEEIRIAVKEAHKAGKRTTTHSHGAEGIKNALRGGIDCIEHGMFIDEEALDYMKEHGVYYVPTLVAPWICAEEGEEKGLPHDAVVKCKRAVARHMESFKMAVAKGVTIAMGTDAGTPFCEHGKAYVDELRLMTVGGYTAEQALLAGTKISAEVLGIEADYGTLEPGKHADFLVLQENPLENIETLRNICEVYQFGNKVKRQYYC
ncbi:MAG: amidohydrolase family protein [Lachnospiraceae bacterium]|nr:amidohydrolase family protein [Lachnospiraceae bacterium]